MNKNGFRKIWVEDGFFDILIATASVHIDHIKMRYDAYTTGFESYKTSRNSHYISPDRVIFILCIAEYNLTNLFTTGTEQKYHICWC